MVEALTPLCVADTLLVPAEQVPEQCRHAEKRAGREGGREGERGRVNESRVERRAMHDDDERCNVVRGADLSMGQWNEESPEPPFAIFRASPVSVRIVARQSEDADAIVRKREDVERAEQPW